MSPETKVPYDERGPTPAPRHAASLRRNIASSYLFDQGQSMADLSSTFEQHDELDAAAAPAAPANERLRQHIRKGERVLRKKLTPIELFLNRDVDDAQGLARARLRVGRLCEGPWGHAVVFVLVVLNAVAMGVEVDQRGRDAFLQRCEHFFFAAFAAEAAFKIFAFGHLYLTDHWNWLDLLILAVMTADVSAHHASSSASVLVPLRLLRITRLLKLVEACAPLLQMVNALYMGLRQVAWLVLLMIAVLYSYALVCTILYGGLAGDNDAAARFEAQSGQSLDETFGTIGNSMLTLLALMTFENCIVVIQPLGRERASAYVVLFSFMVLCSFGFVNMMIAVMSDAFGQFTDPQKVAKLRHERHWRERAVLVGELLFEAIDRDGSGTVSLEELELALATCIDEERQRALSRSERQKMLDIEKYLEMLGLDLDNALSAVRSQTMFYGANLELTPPEFIDLMCRTLEPASKDDVWGVLREVHKIRSHQHAFEQRVEQMLEKRLGDLGARLDEVRDEVLRCLPKTAPPALGVTTEGTRDTLQAAPPALGATLPTTERARDTPPASVASTTSSSLASLVQCLGADDGGGVGATADPRGTSVRVEVIET